MPDVSCRKCGGSLMKFSLCAECRNPLQQICGVCGLQTAQTFHNQCFDLEPPSTNKKGINHGEYNGDEPAGFGKPKNDTFRGDDHYHQPLACKTVGWPS